MSRRKKKLFARKYQPWYHKKSAIAEAMERALDTPPEPPKRTPEPTGGDLTLHAGDAAGATTGGSFTIWSQSPEARLARVKEGMRRWHKAVRRVKVRGLGKR